MTKTTIPMDSYIKASQVFHWATKRHYQLWFTGQDKKRHRRSESVLHRLVKKGKLRSMLYGSKLIYAVPRKGNVDEFSGLSKVVHGLACTEGMVRFWRSDMNGVVVPERFFFGIGSVPEWGIIYPEGTILLYEYCTKSNFYWTGNMAKKLAAYKKNLEKIEQKFTAKAIVVFVLDIPQGVVERWVGSGKSLMDKCFFTDYETFKKVPIGGQLTAPIYLWRDGKQYALRQNV